MDAPPVAHRTTQEAADGIYCGVKSALHCGAGRGAFLSPNDALAGQLVTFAFYHPSRASLARDRDAQVTHFKANFD